MIQEANQKVQAEHLRRCAYLYVRQSTLRQVMENTESTKRQYALRQRAVALGWDASQITVVDSDQGQSGASAVEREGFQMIVTEVGMGRAGIVMGLEVSRLARNSSDWYRLLEICAVTRTLLLDEDGIYDPANFNDRLLLGLKGTMSEAELHLIRSRLRGGLLQKARRGDLGGRLPTGFVYDPQGRVALDPDRQVQETIRHLFQTFRRVGSAFATVRAFRQEGIKFPRRSWGGVHQGELLWDELTHYRTAWILKCPRYAGAYYFGRSRYKKMPDGRVISTKALPREEWVSLLRDAHPAYVTWEEFEENQKRLKENSRAYRSQRQRTPPREGPALLQGLAICSRCGKKMAVHYEQRRNRLYPRYICCAEAMRRSGTVCQSIPGAAIDEAVGKLILEAVTPLNLEVALSVQKEVEARAEEVDRLRRQTVERAQHETELARRRYVQVDPENRLVADQLEAEWNGKLRDLREAQETYTSQKQEDQAKFDEEKRRKILALAAEFPKLWQDPGTPVREKKRMAHLILDDVTLHKAEEITAHVRLKGGTTRTLKLPLPLPFCKLWATKPEVIQEMDRLLGRNTYGRVAELLNERGLRTGTERTFTRQIVGRLCREHKLKTPFQRMREEGLLTASEISEKLSLHRGTVLKWRQRGILTGIAYNDLGECLYEPPSPELLALLAKLSKRRSDPRRRA